MMNRGENIRGMGPRYLFEDWTVREELEAKAKEERFESKKERETVIESKQSQGCGDSRTHKSKLKLGQRKHPGFVSPCWSRLLLLVYLPCPAARGRWM